MPRRPGRGSRLTIDATRERPSHASSVLTSRSDFGAQRLLLDPSILLSDTGIRWLQTDPAAPELVIVSQTFVEALEQGWRPTPFLGSRAHDSFEERKARLSAMLTRLPQFSFADVELPTFAEGVKRRLLEG